LNPAVLRKITKREELAEIEDEWRRLAVLRGNAFITPEWFRCWLDHYGDTQEPLVAALGHEGGGLIGVLALTFPRSGRPRACRIAGANLGDRFHPASSVADEVQVAEAAGAALAGASRPWGVLALEKVDLTEPWVDALAQATGRRLLRLERTRASLPMIDLSAHSGWDAYLATRSSNFRQQVGRFTRRAQRDHSMRLRRTQAAVEVAADIATFFELHDLRHAGASSLRSASARAFHADFAAAALERGWLRLWFLELDGAPVASWYGWRVGDRYAYYNGGFDPAWSGSRPGLILMAAVIEAAFLEGAAEFDLLLGDESYKSRFAERSPTVSDVTLARAFPHPASALSYGEHTLRRAARRLPPSARTRLSRALGRP
jgi:CelD/BcsL family acetyltransferase involved in cellulose biosynthesis